MVTRSADLVDEIVEVVGTGHASTSEPCQELSEDEVEREGAARRAALARKRPLGFTARWDA